MVKRIPILGTMKNGYLSQYFESVAVKKLGAVEVNPAKSNQHEFNGSNDLKRVLFIEQRREFNVKFLLIEEQKAHIVRLVLPKEIHQPNTENQQSWLMNVKQFIDLVKERQKPPVVNSDKK